MSGLGVNETESEKQSDKLELWQMDDRMAILLTLEDKPGILNKALNILTKNGINMTAIQSRPLKVIEKKRCMSFNMDFYGTPDQENVKLALRQLRNLGQGLTEVGTAEVPWFPTKISDFEEIPRLDYLKSEKKTWNFCYSKLESMFEQNACAEYNDIIN